MTCMPSSSGRTLLGLVHSINPGSARALACWRLRPAIANLPRDFGEGAEISTRGACAPQTDDRAEIADNFYDSINHPIL
jgi:hypothetical protein